MSSQKCQTVPYISYNILYNAVYTPIYLQTVIGFICCYLVPSAKPNPEFWFIIHLIKNSDLICIFNERVSHVQCYRINTPLRQSIKNKLFSPIRCKIHEALLNDKVVWSRWEAGSVGLQHWKTAPQRKMDLISKYCCIVLLRLLIRYSVPPAQLRYFDGLRSPPSVLPFWYTVWFMIKGGSRLKN